MSDTTLEWPDRTLESLATYLNGYAFKPRHWGDEGLPIVRIRELLDEDVEPDRYAGNEAAAFKIDDGDLIFSWSATLAALIWTRGPALLNQHLFKVSPAADVDRDFLNHLLNFHLEALAARSHGTTMKHITRGDLASHSVRLPQRNEQVRIAKVLNTLDEQIRAAESITEKLVTIEGAVLNDLLRGIPEGSDRRLGDLLLTPPKNGYSPVAASEQTGAYMLGLGCLTRRGFVPRQLKHAPRRDTRLQPFLLRDGDVLMSRSNTRELVGQVGIFRDVGAPCYYPDLMMRLVPSESIGAEYLAIVLNSASVRRQIMNVASGTSGSMVKVSRSIVEALTLPVPAPVDQDRIVAAVVGLRSALDLELEQLQKTRLLKVGLMRDLLTGLVRVPSGASS
ncbi:restriction endonuclease subunit S [Nocardioides piscis]|uniref:Type I restriction modification DNA specificity domain-containing protein n=1 Tax=Nocardioides piscis TaxID=2714938 RepID=A0A6G7YGD3_9ACTN|nr:restriction endonuclease subunit S [Nocardioides piscis]QIK75701.1 hypothetical protein G7071_09845 [Nocardioides piscis]